MFEPALNRRTMAPSSVIDLAREHAGLVLRSFILESLIPLVASCLVAAKTEPDPVGAKRVLASDCVASSAVAIFAVLIVLGDLAALVSCLVLLVGILLAIQIDLARLKGRQAWIATLAYWVGGVLSSVIPRVLSS
jgi:hypothetical protein